MKWQQSNEQMAYQIVRKLDKPWNKLMAIKSDQNLLLVAVYCLLSIQVVLVFIVYEIFSYSRPLVFHLLFTYFIFFALFDVENQMLFTFEVKPSS